VWVADLGDSRVVTLDAGARAPITALGMSADGGRVAFGDENGRAGVIDLNG
jgi:hypothetical protein